MDSLVVHFLYLYTPFTPACFGSYKGRNNFRTPEALKKKLIVLLILISLGFSNYFKIILGYNKINRRVFYAGLVLAGAVHLRA